MRITRIFRKYSRILLLVFMSLLLVVFLIGDVIDRARYSYATRDVEIGRAFGGPVFLRQTQAAENDFDLAQRLGVPIPPIRTDDVKEGNLAMYLLLEEARRAGVRVGRDQIVESFRRVPGAAEVLAAIRDRSGRSLNSIYDSIARVAAARVLADAQLGLAAGTSLPELERTYRDQKQNARVLLSVIDSRAFRSHVDEPTEDELLANFEAGKDRFTQHTDQELVFGYRIPDRVQVEYLTVDPSAIQPLVSVSEKQARHYYDENKPKYTKTVEGASPFELEEGEPQKIQMTYEEVKEQVREDCRQAKAVDEAQRLMNRVHEEARRPWSTAPLDEDHVRQAPSEDALVPFSELQREFSSEYPVVLRKTGLVTQSDLATERGFGRAGKVIRKERLSAPELAFRVEGLPTAPEGEDERPLRIDEPGPLVVELRPGGPGEEPAPYQAYVFRVVAIEPSGPPASLDEVRAEVVENVMQIKAFELAGEQARALAEAARREGLEQAVADARELRALLGESESPPSSEPASRPAVARRYLNMLEPFEPEQFHRRPRGLKNVGRAPSLHEEVFALADQSGSSTTDEHHLAVVPLANKSKWVVADLLEVQPIYREEFEQQRDDLERQALWLHYQTFVEEWFNPDNILARTGFVPKPGLEQ